MLGTWKRLRPRQPTVAQGRQVLSGQVASHRSRLHAKEPWHQGWTVGSGAVAGACQHVIEARCKRAGMRWKRQGCLHVLE